MLKTDLHSFVEKYAPEILSSVHPLSEMERIELLANGNTAQSWDTIGIVDGFNPKLVRGSDFSGCVVLGKCSDTYSDESGFYLHQGIYNSKIRNSIIKDNVAINAVHCCNFYKIEENAVLHNIGEITSSQTARFGQGGIQNGSQKWIDIINENGGRAVIPFTGMTCGDAFIWAKYRDDFKLQNLFSSITDTTCIPNMSTIGIVGNNVLIRNVKIINDTSFNEYAQINGADIISNATIRSSKAEKTVIGAGVQLRNAIIGYGNHIDSGAQLQSVLSGSAVSIHQCARISQSIIGDNAGIGCCEIANCLIFPSHGQHHNSSFLIASMIGGQSNIASGATIGSNHNSRANDGELWASRGFWPGLCTSFKHNSRFASYTLCAKADYQYEIDNPFPFSLIANDSAHDTLIIHPAYYFTHNMYSFMRSKFKFTKRDKRIIKEQKIEHNPLAPDTIEEIFRACSIIEEETAKVWYHVNQTEVPSIDECRKKGRSLLIGSTPAQDLEFKGRFEKSSRKNIIRNPSKAWQAYTAIIRWYAAGEIVNFINSHNPDLHSLQIPPRTHEWINCGGQIVKRHDLDRLLLKIKNDSYIKTWDDIHERFDILYEHYEQDRFYHALGALAAIDNIREESFTAAHLKSGIQKCIPICKDIADHTSVSRLKDYNDHYRTMVYESRDELNAVLGAFDDDTVISDVGKAMQLSIDEIVKLAEKL